MKKILAIAVFVTSFCVLATSARAESNPLLTIFEGIETTHAPSNIVGTPVDVVVIATVVYSKATQLGSGSLSDRQVTWQTDKRNDDGTRFLVWNWIDKKFAREYYDGRRINPPTATLEITAMKGVIIRAKYTYSFLDLRKDLYK